MSERLTIAEYNSKNSNFRKTYIFKDKIAVFNKSKLKHPKWSLEEIQILKEYLENRPESKQRYSVLLLCIKLKWRSYGEVRSKIIQLQRKK